MIYSPTYTHEYFPSCVLLVPTPGQFCPPIVFLRVENLRAAATTSEATNTALPARCPHAMAVFETADPRPATPLLDGMEVVEQALSRLPQAAFSEKTIEDIRKHASRAEAEGVPLVVRLGDTNWFAVRDGAKFNRTVIGEWGHVKCTHVGGDTTIQCKVRGACSRICVSS